MAEAHDGSRPHAGRSPEECEQLFALLLKTHPEIPRAAIEELDELEPCDKLRQLEMACVTMGFEPSDRKVN